MKRRLAAAAAAAALLLSACAPAPLDLPEAPAETDVIAYVPLDDRPDNVGRVRYLAESLGYQLHMPETAYYRTALDGQAENEGGLSCGSPLELYAWVQAQEAAGCDRYILSMDQMLSGGLVNSRSMKDDAVPIPPHVSFFVSASDLLADLLALLMQDGDNRVFLLDSVMRLAPTVGYRGGTVEAYNALRSYGAQPRPTLVSPTLESVAACSPLGADGRALAAADYGLTEAALSDYLSVRLRKLTLSDAMLRQLSAADAGQIRVLVGIDDSSEEESIQKNEIAYLRTLLRAGDVLLSGVDDLAFKAVARMYLDETNWQGASVSVRYFGGTEDRPACDYDSQSLRQIVGEHLDYFDLWQTDASGALTLLVLTQPKDEGQKDAYIRALAEDLSACQEAGAAVMLIDAGNGRYGTAFHQALLQKVQLGALLSYAGFLDMAIVTGTAVSHAVARYARLLRGQATQQEEAAFCKGLTDSIVKDFCYKHIVREDLLTYIRRDLEGDPNNFCRPEIPLDGLMQRLEAGMRRTAAPVLRNLEKSDRLLSLSPRTQAGWGTLALSNFHFPWLRAFEIEMDIAVGPVLRPHGPGLFS